MKHKIKIILLTNLIFLTFLYVFSFNKLVIGKAANKDFDIKNGVLLHYFGKEKNVTIPKSVKQISENAFYCRDIETIIIPDTVRKIGQESFLNCSKLRSVILSNSLTTIPCNAFMSCINLKKITIPKNIKKIERGAFWNCKKLNTVKILNKDIYIANDVFTDTAWLNNKKNTFVSINGNLIKYNGDDPVVLIPDNIRVICGEAFHQLEGLEKIIIPSSVKIIGEKAFNLCKDLRIVNMTNSVVEIYDSAFCQCYSLENISLSENLKVIGPVAFYDSGLESIIIPKSVKSIGNDAFGSCDNLENVELPEELTNIATDAFTWTPWIDKLKEESNNDFIIINSKLFAYKGKSTSVIIPDGVTAIMSDTFKKSNIKEVIMPNSITEIGYCAFNGCNNLCKIKFSQNTKRIEMYAFQECNSLKSLSLPSKLIFIGDQAFSWCSNLKNITFPHSIKIMGYDVLASCNKLKTVKYNGNRIVYEHMQGYKEFSRMKFKLSK